jgi:ArsR family transcriptional regulator, virulence genes transcriptional regulator
MNIEYLKSHATEVADLMKILANSHRLLILCELHKRECNVGDLQRAVGISQSALSQHLAKLRNENLVSVRREAQTIHYSLTDPNMRDVMALLYRLYCDPSSNLPTPKETTDDN